MQNKEKEQQNILFVLAGGILARLLYIIFMPVTNFAQYDIGSVYWDQESFTGHLGYILYLVRYHALPDFDPTTVYQFNHPPVHHILCALWVSFIRLFTDNVEVWIESIQWVTLVYSVITLFAIYGITKTLKMSHKGTLAVLILWAFQPTLIMTAGSINNDGAGLMFQVLAVWFALKWYRDRSYQNILGVALTIGFGMISKLSAGLIAVPIGALFVYVFVTEWKKGKKFPLKRFWQYLVFGLVVCPIGLCWVVRCYVKYGMSPTYIAYLPTTSPQYVGMYSAAERLLFPNPVTFLSNLAHGSLGMGWNLWVQLLRTSALGECDLSTFPMWGKALCLVMIFGNLYLMIWSLGTFVRVIFTKCTLDTEDGQPMDPGSRIFWGLGWLTEMYSYITFANSYPHECSMNFRYVQFAMLPPMIALGLIRPSEVKWKKILRKLVFAAYVLVSLGICLLWILEGQE